MLYSKIETKLQSLPETALLEVDSYIDYVRYKFAVSENANMPPSKKGFGCLKEIPCKMSPDFDEPLDDFAEYM